MNMRNFYAEIYHEQDVKQKANYKDLLFEFRKIGAKYEPNPAEEAKLAFLAFLESKLFVCECGAKFSTVQAKNGHKKGCKI